MALTPRQMAVIRARARAKKAKSAAEMQRPTALGGLGYQPEEETSRQAFRAGTANVPVPETQPQRPKAPTRLGAVAGQFAQSATLGQAPNILAAPYALTGQFPEAKAFYQQRLQQGAQAFPVSTAAADIAGFVAPAGAVAKGVMSAARPAVNVLARAIPSTGVTRMGGRIAAGAGLGATEGALYGGTVEAERRAMQAGQAAPTMEERGQAALPAAGLGAVVGGALPVVGRALQPVGTAIAGQAVKAFGPGATARQAERVAQKAVRADLQRAGINNLDDFLKAAEQYQGKPVMTAELTQSMTNSLTALTRAKGTTGDKVKAILENRIQGFPERMMRDLQDATGLDPAAILDNLDDLIKSRQAVAAPEYAKAFAEPFTMTPQLRALIEGSPEAAAAFEDVQKIFQTKLAGTGKTFEDVPKLEVYDSVKKNLDERVRRLLKKGKTSQANAIADFTERFRNELDVIVPDKYKAARVAGGEAPSLREANKAGSKAFRLPFDMFKKEFAKVQGADAEAFKGAFVREIANAIEKNPTQASAILSPEFQSKLRLMFGEQAADRLATNVRNEISMRTTGARFNPNVGAVSSQALMGVPSQQADEMLAAGEATLEFAQNLMSGRWSSAVGPVLNYFRRAGYTEAQLNAIGDLLTSDPQRAAKLLFPNEMARLGASARGAAATNVLANPTQPPSGGRNTLAMPPEVGGAFVGGALGATQGETPEERARNALLGAAGGAVGGRLARGAAIDRTRMGSNLGNVLAPQQPQGPKVSPLGFYSELENAVMQSTTNRAAAAQWKATISKAPNVKAEEMEWTGFNDWLDLQTKPVSKQEALDYLKTKGVQLEETVLGGTAQDAELQRQLLPLIEERDRLQAAMIDDNSPAISAATQDATVQDAARVFSNAQAAETEALARALEGGDVDTNAAIQAVAKARLALQRAVNNAMRHLNDQISELQDDARVAKGNTKWSEYTLPGGENYREVLLKLPQAPHPQPGLRFAKNVLEKINTPEDVSNARKFGPLEFREAIKGLTDEQVLEAARTPFPQDMQFRSSHWEDPNVLAHMRFKERDIDGKRVMALEEIQSDWHQAGRDKGYQAELTAGEKRLQDFNARSWGTGKPVEDAEMAEWNALKENYGESLQQKVKGVPNAPFKNNAWVQLVLKRALRYAAENDFDELAWIPGNVQNGKIVNANDNRGDFYDKIVVNAANRLGKKYGATTGRRTVDGPQGEKVQLHSLPITPEMRKQILEKGVPLFSVAAGASMIPQDQKKPPGQRPRG
jgi:hypothetical protein